VSKERARRRAEREEAADLQRARAARRDRLRSLTGLRRLYALRVSRLSRSAAPASRRAPSSALGRHRGRQNGLLLAVLLPLNAVYWLVQPAWSWRAGALVATALAWPVLVVVFFDRRPSR
jgi:Flp pilus assembly protein TadB